MGCRVGTASLHPLRHTIRVLYSVKRNAPRHSPSAYLSGLEFQHSAPLTLTEWRTLKALQGKAFVRYLPILSHSELFRIHRMGKTFRIPCVSIRHTECGYTPLRSKYLKPPMQAGDNWRLVEGGHAA
jgi:hypothetical protein